MKTYKNKIIFHLGILVFFLVSTLAYRLRLERYFFQTYPSHFPQEWFTGLEIFLKNDLLVILNMSLVFIGLEFMFLPVVLYRVLVGSLYLFYLLALFTGIVFFTIFEAPFQMNMMGSGLDTFWREIINSALYEIEIAEYFFLVIPGFLFLLFLFSFSLVRLQKEPLIGIFVLLFLFGLTERMFLYIQDRERTTGQYRTPVTNVRYSSFGENPFVTVLARNSRSRKEIRFSVEDLDPNDFRYGLDTSSLVSDKRFPKISLPRGKKYNIIYYFFESTAFKRIGNSYKGESLTPVWENLRKNSFVSDRHYANSPLSVNSMVSALGSSYTNTNNLWIPMTDPDYPIVTIPQILKKKGYRTGLIQSGSLKNFGHRGFLKKRDLDLLVDYYDLNQKIRYPQFVAESIDDRDMVEFALEFMDQSKDSPFFMALFPNAPHHPYMVPDKKFEIIRNIDRIENKNQKLELRYKNSLYYADYCLGMLIEGIRKRGLLDDTLVFVFADHGEAFYDHRQNYLHALFLYEENVHVPFLVYNPRLFPETLHYEGISRHIDIMPTTLDILGISGREKQEGVSLWGAHSQQLASFQTFWNRSFAGVRDGKWKYILDLETGQEQLFNLEEDPGEQTNLIGENPEVAKTYKEYVLRAQSYKAQAYRKTSLRNPPTSKRPLLRREGSK